MSRKIHARNRLVTLILVDHFAFDDVANLLTRGDARLRAGSRLDFNQLDVWTHIVEITEMLHADSRNSFERLPRVIGRVHYHNVGITRRRILNFVPHEMLGHCFATVLFAPVGLHEDAAFELADLCQFFLRSDKINKVAPVEVVVLA